MNWFSKQKWDAALAPVRARAPADAIMGAPSYVSAVSREPLIGQTIGRYLDDVCAVHKERLALISRHQRLRWTYAQLKSEVDSFAAGLLSLGLVPGDRVGVWSPNCAEWLVAQYATAKIGVILVNINPAYRTSEVAYALNKVGCKALITAVQHKTSNYISMLQELAPELGEQAAQELALDRLPSLRYVITIGEEAQRGCLRFGDVAPLAGPAECARMHEIGATLQFDDPVNIQFTSGTTGHPKGATLSHHNIINNGFFVGEAIRLTSEDRVCAPVPLYHCFGMVMANLACLTHGACVVYPAESFDPQAALEAVAAEACTAIYGVPTMFIAMLGQDLSKYKLTSLRTGIMAGSPCPIEVMREVIDRMHTPEITIAYGMTETSPVSFQSSTADNLERRVTTVGRIQPHLEVKIVDEAGRIVPRGRPGEICTRGYSVMLRYWDDAERTAEVLDEAGWMHTGDLGTLDEAGYCNIVGRIKDMVIRGGENIYPREIEEFLYAHASIKDVQVIGVPDLKYGDELCACIILKDEAKLDEEGVRAFCKGKIAHYKIPKYIRFVDAFPTTVTGKVQKFVMRDAIASELDLKARETA